MSSGSGVSQWNDLSGSSNNVTQPSSTLQPIYWTNVLNGLPTVRFDGVSTKMTIPNISWGTVIVVAKRTASNQSLFERTPCCSSSKRGFSVLDFATTFDTFDQYYVNGTIAASPSSWGSTFAVVSGVLQSSVLTGAANLGYGSPSFGYLNGDIAEMFVWNNVLSDTDRIKVQRYLGAKYNISVQ